MLLDNYEFRRNDRTGRQAQRQADRQIEAETEGLQMIYCILVKTHKLNYAHRQTNKTYKQQNRQTKQNKSYNRKADKIAK